MPSQRKRSFSIFLLVPAAPVQKHLLNIKKVPDDLSRITKELMITEILKPRPTSASNSSTSSGSSLSTGSFDQLHSQSTKLHIQQSIIAHSYLISLCVYIYIYICICLCIYILHYYKLLSITFLELITHQLSTAMFSFLNCVGGFQVR